MDQAILSSISLRQVTELRSEVKVTPTLYHSVARCIILLKEVDAIREYFYYERMHFIHSNVYVPK